MLTSPEVQGIDLFIPPVYDLLGSVAVLAVLALVVWAFISFFKDSQHLNLTQSLVWFLLILFVPFLGAIAWLLAGRVVGGHTASQENAGSPDVE